MTFVVLLLQVSLCAAPDAALAPRLALQPGADIGPQASDELSRVLAAQEPGTALRLRLLDGSQREGALARVDGGVVTIAPGKRDVDLSVPAILTDVPLGGVETLWVASGDRGVIGAGIGMILGAAAGVGLALAIASANDSLYGRSSSSGAGLIALPLTSALGGLAGWRVGKGLRVWGRPLWTAPKNAADAREPH